MMNDSKITSCTQDASLKDERSPSKFKRPNHRFGILLKNQKHQIPNETFHIMILVVIKA
ncbi:hypothetical protein [Clostridium beijerinckii]|nr:hypothetical protein [Clostridium beijerinckii]